MRDAEVEKDDFLEKTIEDADFYRRRNEKINNLVPGTFQWYFRNFLNAASIKDWAERKRTERSALEGGITRAKSFRDLHLLAFAVESRRHDDSLPHAQAIVWLLTKKILALHLNRDQKMVCMNIVGLMLPLRRFDEVCDQLFSELFVECKKCQDLVDLYPCCPKTSQKLTIRNAIGRRATFGELEEMFMTQQYKFLNFSADTIFHWMERVGTEIEMEDFWNRALAAGSKSVKTFLKERKEKPPERQIVPKKVAERKALFCQENRCPGQRLGMSEAKKNN